MSRNAWRSLAVIVLIPLAILASCLVIKRRETAPGPIVVPASSTPIPITVHAVTNTPSIEPATETPPPTPTSTYPVPLDILTRTNTPNPSTLITPSPAALPATGGDNGRGQTSPLLIGMGLILASIGFVMLRSRKHLSW